MSRNIKNNTVKPDFTKNIRLPKEEADYWASKLENKGFKPPKSANSWVKPIKIFQVKFKDGKYGKIVFNDDSHKGVSASIYLEDENHIVIDRVMNESRLLPEWVLRDPKSGKLYRIGLCVAIPKEKTFAVDVHWTLAKVYEVKATSREEAEKKIQALVNAGEVNVYKDGFETTDDVEVKCSGEEGKDGKIEFYE